MSQEEQMRAKLFGGVVALPTPRFGDSRGNFAVLYEEQAVASAGITGHFVQDNYSLSRLSGTIRGLHLQLPPWEQGKLIRVLRGAILDVFVDLRPESATFGRHGSMQMAAVDDLQLWIPAGFAHGFCTLEPDTELLYKVDAPYRPEAERSLAWDDPTVGIDWPVPADRIVLSDKDATGQDFASIVAEIASSVEATV
jgi:dTDP-4-dehydrorhamnose 3,5-epimerase